MTDTAPPIEPYTPPQTAAAQVAALAPYYTVAAEQILGIEGDHAEAQEMVDRAAQGIIDGFDEYGSSGLFSHSDERLIDEERDEIRDAINYRAERLRRRALGIRLVDRVVDPERVG